MLKMSASFVGKFQGFDCKNVHNLHLNIISTHLIHIYNDQKGYFAGKKKLRHKNYMKGQAQASLITYADRHF